MKDSDYFDSELNDRTDLERLKKAYDSCEIANYQTPQTEKLQTVQIKTYLFDRNLTKIEAWAVFDDGKWIKKWFWWYYRFLASILINYNGTDILMLHNDNANE